eukprot:763521-Hanusia_phi.AAC.4
MADGITGSEQQTPGLSLRFFSSPSSKNRKWIASRSCFVTRTVRMTIETCRQFIDRTRMLAVGGRGGNGCVSMSRVAARDTMDHFGGPSGGPGGRGGGVYVRASSKVV